MIRRLFAILVKSLPLAVAVLVVAQVVVTNELAGLGQTATGVEGTIEVLERKNDILRQKVASASSLIRIEQKARELGFSEPTSTSYLPLGSEPIALKNSE